MQKILFGRSSPEAIAIRSTSPRTPLTYRALRRQIDYTLATLNGAGIGRGDRVATVMNNSPEAATTFLCLAAGTSFAPLNPAYKESELEFYLNDLKPKVVIVDEVNASSAVIPAAGKLGIPTVRLCTNKDGPAGEFALDTSELPSHHFVNRGGYADSEDEALILHTSGTTGRAKMVPLKLKNLAASAYNISRTLSLTSADTGLVIAPMFHIHGLMAGILSALYAGGSIFCPPSAFSPTKFFEWMKEGQPSWYTGVPAMHRLILEIGTRPEFVDIVNKSALRFIRSSSDSLPPVVLEALEKMFRTVVVESYGMTEAAHQMASNPLDRARRKAGTVGFPAGPEIRIMADDDTFLPAGEEGHIVIRGDNVTNGYFENPEANAKDFKNGWFDTGDIGSFDSDGYLTISGREKDIINRGGEKIMPVEVTYLLLQHPAIAQVAVFGVPDALLGQRVGAAIVLREGEMATEEGLKVFAAEHLARFKVPERWAFVDDIPKGPTGKVQRKLLPYQLGFVTENSAPTAPVPQAAPVPSGNAAPQ
jgi:acyl-CoA synthetase (AMP-forming)/AMP-acid ligase II